MQPQFIDPRNPPPGAFERLRAHIDKRKAELLGRDTYWYPAVGAARGYWMVRGAFGYVRLGSKFDPLNEHNADLDGPAPAPAPQPTQADVTAAFDAKIVARLTAVRNHTGGNWSDEHREIFEWAVDARLFRKRLQQPETIEALYGRLCQAGDLAKLVRSWRRAVVGAAKRVPTHELMRQTASEAVKDRHKRSTARAREEAKAAAEEAHRGGSGIDRTIIGSAGQRPVIRIRVHLTAPRTPPRPKATGSDQTWISPARAREIVDKFFAETPSARKEFPELAKADPLKAQRADTVIKHDFRYGLPVESRRAATHLSQSPPNGDETPKRKGSRWRYVWAQHEQLKGEGQSNDQP